MKLIAIIVVFPLLFNLSTQIPQFHNCSSEIIARFQDECESVICQGNENYSRLSCGLVGCPRASDCPGAIKLVLPDHSKTYPDCCGRCFCPTS